MFPRTTLHKILERRASEAPQRLAVWAQGREITYGELDSRAGRLARKLVSLGVRPETPVGLCVDRSLEMVVGLVAILKAGGAYVPIDPEYPRARIRYLLADSGVETVLTVPRVADRLEGSGTVRVDVAAEGPTAPARAALPALREPDSLAYVIYTSGSTGAPKGVSIEHRNVVRLFEQTEPWFRFSERDVWTMFHSLSFDFSVWEIWGALLYGGSLVIVPHEIHRSPERFSGLLAEHRVTVLNLTPSAFRQLSSSGMRPPASLRLVIFGGEKLEPDLLRPWIARHGDESPQLINMYGITETCVHATYQRMRSEDLEPSDSSPIGVPIPDLRVHLFDPDGRSVDEGPGEMYLSGPGLARGYFNRPQLTAERFVEKSVGGPEPVRMYRSGDMAFRTCEGQLRYLGRCDGQLKVRGFRIEPAEVESCLASHSGVEAAVVTALDYGDGDTRLAAYVLARNGDAPERLEAELVRLSAAELPAHMRPSTYRFVDEMPMTPHGKLDVAALKRLAQPWAREDPATDTGGLTPTEKTVLEIWEEALQRRGVLLDDDLFDGGGTSMALVRILARVNRHFDLRLTGGLFTESVTAARLAAAVDSQLARRSDRCPSPNMPQEGGFDESRPRPLEPAVQGIAHDDRELEPDH